MRKEISTPKVQNIQHTVIGSQSINSYQIQYNLQQSQQGLIDFKQKYRALEATNEPIPDKQKLKKTILFLGAKKIFATTRKNTINKLIDTYESSGKTTKNFDKLDTTGKHISDSGDLIGTLIPGGSVPAKLLGKGISTIAKLFKSNSLTDHSQNFENHLIEDEKSTLLLEETYCSLNSSLQDNHSKLSLLLTQMFNLGSKQFNQYNVFEVSGIQKQEELTQKKMEKVIELLTKNFKDFEKEFQQEVSRYAEKIETFFAEEDNNLLQDELTELLEKLDSKDMESESILLNQQIAVPEDSK
jgi:hypothetical protein